MYGYYLKKEKNKNKKVKNMDLINMVCPPGAGCPLDNLLGIGLPEVLLWVLVFAITFAALKYVINKKSALLVSMVIAFFVLMAIPATLIEFIAGMSTSVIVLLIGVLAVMTALTIAGPKVELTDPKTGKVTGYVNWAQQHGTVLAAIMIALVALIFIASGGLAIIGLSSLVPMFSTGTLLLVIIGLAVLWMVMEAA